MPIRRTTFTWNPDHEPRSAAWARIKTHIQHELDRIHANHMETRRTARRQASSRYARNQQLVAAARQGTPLGELAHQFGISQQQVREIIRIEQHWMLRFSPGQLSGQDGHPARHGWPRDCDDVLAGVPRTTMTLL
jgi:hypothetical protein